MFMVLSPWVKLPGIPALGWRATELGPELGSHTHQPLHEAVVVGATFIG